MCKWDTMVAERKKRKTSSRDDALYAPLAGRGDGGWRVLTDVHTHRGRTAHPVHTLEHLHWERAPIMAST